MDRPGQYDNDIGRTKVPSVVQINPHGHLLGVPPAHPVHSPNNGPGILPAHSVSTIPNAMPVSQHPVRHGPKGKRRVYTFEEKASHVKEFEAEGLDAVLTRNPHLRKESLLRWVSAHRQGALKKVKRGPKPRVVRDQSVASFLQEKGVGVEMPLTAEMIKIYKNDYAAMYPEQKLKSVVTFRKAIMRVREAESRQTGLIQGRVAEVTESSGSSGSQPAPVPVSTPSANVFLPSSGLSSDMTHHPRLDPSIIPPTVPMAHPAGISGSSPYGPFPNIRSHGMEMSHGLGQGIMGHGGHTVAPTMGIGAKSDQVAYGIARSELLGFAGNDFKRDLGQMIDLISHLQLESGMNDRQVRGVDMETLRRIQTWLRDCVRGLET